MFKDKRSIRTGETFPSWLDLDEKDVPSKVASGLLVREEDTGTWSIVRQEDGTIDGNFPTKEAAIRVARLGNEHDAITIEELTGRKARKLKVHAGMLAKYGEDQVTVTGVDGNDVKVLTPSGQEFFVDITQLAGIKEAQDMLDSMGDMEGVAAGEWEVEVEADSLEDMEKVLEDLEDSIGEAEEDKDEEDEEGMRTGPPMERAVEITPTPDNYSQQPKGAKKTAITMSWENGDIPTRRTTPKDLKDLLARIGIPIRASKQISAAELKFIPNPQDPKNETFIIETSKDEEPRRMNREDVLRALTAAPYNYEEGKATEVVHRVQLPENRYAITLMENTEGLEEEESFSDIMVPPAAVEQVSPAIAAAMQANNISRVRVAKLLEILKEAEGVEKCPSCGADLTDGEEGMKCMYCGYMKPRTAAKKVIAFRVGEQVYVPSRDSMATVVDIKGDLYRVQLADGTFDMVEKGGLELPGQHEEEIQEEKITFGRPTGAKPVPTCKKCGKQHWPFQKCDQAGKKEPEKGKEAPVTTEEVEKLSPAMAAVMRKRGIKYISAAELEDILDEDEPNEEALAKERGLHKGPDGKWYDETGARVPSPLYSIEIGEEEDEKEYVPYSTSLADEQAYTDWARSERSDEPEFVFGEPETEEMRAGTDSRCKEERESIDTLKEIEEEEAASGENGPVEDLERTLIDALEDVEGLEHGASKVITADPGRGQGLGKGGPPQGDRGADVCIGPNGEEKPHTKGTPCTVQYGPGWRGSNTQSKPEKGAAKPVPTCKKCGKQHWPFQKCDQAGKKEPEKEKKESEIPEKEAGKVRMSFDWNEFFTDVMPQLSTPKFESAFESSLNAVPEITASQEERKLYQEELDNFRKEANKRGLPNPEDMAYGIGDKVASKEDPDLLGRVTEYKLAGKDTYYLLDFGDDSPLWYKEAEIFPDTEDNISVTTDGDIMSYTTPEGRRATKSTENEWIYEDTGETAPPPVNKQAAIDKVSYDYEDEKFTTPTGVEYTKGPDSYYPTKFPPKDMPLDVSSRMQMVVDQYNTRLDIVKNELREQGIEDEAELRRLAEEDEELQDLAIRLNDLELSQYDRGPEREGKKAAKSEPTSDTLLTTTPWYDRSHKITEPANAEQHKDFNNELKEKTGSEKEDWEKSTLKDVVSNFGREAIIRKCAPSDRNKDKPAEEQIWCLYTKHKPERVLGRHPSRDKALAQERAIKAHGIKTVVAEDEVPIEPTTETMEEPVVQNFEDLMKRSEEIYNEMEKLRPKITATEESNIAADKALKDYTWQSLDDSQLDYKEQEEYQKLESVKEEAQTGYTALQEEYAGLEEELKGIDAQVSTLWQNAIPTAANKKQAIGEPPGTTVEPTPKTKSFAGPPGAMAGDRKKKKPEDKQAEEEAKKKETKAARQTLENLYSYTDALLDRVQTGNITVADAQKEIKAEADQWEWSKDQVKYVKEKLQGKVASLGLPFDIERSPAPDFEFSSGGEIARDSAFHGREVVLCYHDGNYKLYNTDYGYITPEGAKEKDIKAQLSSFGLSDDKVTTALKDAKTAEVVIKVGALFNEKDLKENYRKSVEPSIEHAVTAALTQWGPQATRAQLMMTAMDEFAKLEGGAEFARIAQDYIKDKLDKELSEYPREEYDGKREFPQSGLTGTKKTARTYTPEEKKKKVSEFKKHSIPLDDSIPKKLSPWREEETDYSRDLNAVAFKIGDRVRDMAMSEITGTVTGFEGENLVHVKIDASRLVPGGADGLYMTAGLLKMAQLPEFDDAEESEERPDEDKDDLDIWETPKKEEASSLMY